MIKNIVADFELTDENIVKFLTTNSGKLCISRVSKRYLSNHPWLKDFLDNRYEYFESYGEVYHRLKYHIEERPVCLHCGKPVKYIGIVDCPDNLGYRQFCCKKCSDSSEIKKEKTQNTVQERYGVRNIFCDHEYISKHYKEKTGYDSYWDVPGYKENLANKHIEETGYAWHIASPNVVEKIKQTNNDAYGCDYPLQNIEVLEKTRKSFKENSGYDYTFQDPKIREKGKETCEKKYNDTNYNNREKAKKTSLEIYGSEYPQQSDIVKNKVKTTCLEKYGYECIFNTKTCKEKANTPEAHRKTIETKKKNKTINTSSVEQQFIKILNDNNIDYKYQYHSSLYPYDCDFYFPKIDLYLEIQGSWVHGKKPFNNQEDDIKILNKWLEKSQTSNYYKNAIRVWTIRDVEKRNCAKENKLNYIEIFSTKIEDVINSLNEKYPELLQLIQNC